jgi:endo-1,4-beta-xylanase
VPSATMFLLLACMIACGGGSNNANTPPSSLTLGQTAARHNIKVGAAADSPYLSDNNYAVILGSEFSQLQAENEMKFATIHPATGNYNFSGGDALVSFAQAHTMVVRGHTLVWHNQVPSWVTTGKFTPLQLSAILQDHIATVMGHYAGKVYAWDVINEAFNDDGTMRDTIWYDQPGIGFGGLGTQYIEQALDWARMSDPNAQLFYNDYNAEPINAKSDAIFAMAQDFKTRGVPLDGIGFQLHIDLSYDTPAFLASFAHNLQRFATLGLDLHITELDIRLSDSSSASFNAQAKLYGEMAAICVQQPACKLFQTWGFTDKHSWISSFYPGQGWALLWDANYQKKPAYDSVLNALK